MRTGLCTGPSHAEPVYLPVTPEHWYFHKSGRSTGKPVTPCRTCVNWKKLINKGGPHGLVAAAMVVPWARELVERCDGLYRVQRLHGIGETTLRAIVNGDNPHVQKRTAQRILVALASQRSADRRNGHASERYNGKLRAAGDREKLINSHMEREYGLA